MMLVYLSMSGIWVVKGLRMKFCFEGGVGRSSVPDDKTVRLQLLALTFICDKRRAWVLDLWVG